MAALIFSALVSLFLGYKAYQTFDYRRVPFAKYFIFLMLCMAWWTIFYAGEIGFSNLENKFLCTLLSYPGNSFLPTMWFLFAAEYCNIGRKFIRKYEKLFFAISLLDLLALYSNSWHWLFYRSLSIEIFEQMPLLVLEHGSLFWLLYGYFSLLSLLGISFFLSRFLLSKAGARLQLGVLALGALLPLCGNFLYIFDIGPFAFIDPTAFSFAFGGFLFFGVTRKQAFLNLVPVARENAVETMKEGYIVLDEKGLIVDINSAALRLFEISRKAALGNKLQDILEEKIPSLSKSNPTIPSTFPLLGIFSIKKASKLNYYSLSISPLRFEGWTRGKLVLIHDVTESQRYGEALRQANAKIKLMSSITRHDILNQINVLSGYTELLSERLPQELRTDPLIDKYLANLKKSIEAIQNQISFTKDYQELGILSPVWHSVEKTAKEASTSLSDSGIEFFIRTGSLEVYADSLFLKAFYNLFDNAWRHGGGVSKLWVNFFEKEEGAILEIRDNGVGIASDMKETIFEKSVGKNTGLGLFLVKSILSITGMEIRERGLEGEGARFEILIPPENWRLAEASSQD